MGSNRYMDNKKLLNKLGSEGTPEYRFGLVMYAKKNGISQTATHYETTRKTVRKWVVAFEKEGMKGLANKSRIGQAHPDTLPSETVQQLLDYRSDSNVGAYYIKDALDLSCSLKTINKYLKRNGLVSKQKTKSKKKKDMTEMRQRVKVFEKIQIDTKYLTDIANLMMGIKFLNFPKYRFTARDYKSGLTFTGYSYTKDSTSMGIFAAYVIHRLKQAGVDTKTICFQPDNGTEFTSYAKKKGHSFFEEVCINNDVEYHYIPIGRPTYNSDVESFHGTCEREFYSFDQFLSRDDFILKSWMYTIWYNMFRKNRNKEHKTPRDILKEINFKKPIICHQVLRF